MTPEERQELDELKAAVRVLQLKDRQEEERFDWLDGFITAVLWLGFVGVVIAVLW